MGYTEIHSSSLLDLLGYRVTSAKTVQEAYQLSDEDITPLPSDVPPLRVALTLRRANNPQPLLDLPWGERQNALKKLNDSNTLWKTYGASQEDFDTAVDIIRNELEITILDETNSDLITSAESRTIWLELKPDDFQRLFGLRPFLFFQE